MDQNETEHLYFIGIVPPASIQESIVKFKQEIRKLCGSKHAFNAPPHITLHMPFTLKAKKKQTLLDQLNTIKLQSQKETIRIKNFNCFRPRVIYAAVEPNESLDELQKQVAGQLRKIQVFNSNYKDRPFVPHVTLAFRDLKKRDFNSVWSFFEHRQFEAPFTLTNFYLLQHLGKEWRIIESFEV